MDGGFCYLKNADLEIVVAWSASEGCCKKIGSGWPRLKIRWRGSNKHCSEWVRGQS